MELYLKSVQFGSLALEHCISRDFEGNWHLRSLVPRPLHSFCRLQYEKHGEPGNEASIYVSGNIVT